MNLSAPFILRPIATILLTIAILVAGAFAYGKLPVSPLPQVDFPTIVVTGQLPGASPETVASSLAAPLERHLGQIADVTEMTSSSQTSQARITLQFGLDRNIDGAARDVEAAINAARADLPSNLLSNPTYRKVNPADSPVLILALTSHTLTRGQMYDQASTVIGQLLSQVDGVGQVLIGGAALPAVRVELNPQVLFRYGIGLEDVRAAIAGANANSPHGTLDLASRHYELYSNDQASHAADYRPLVVAYRHGTAVRLDDVASVADSVQDLRNLGLSDGKPAVLVIVFRAPGANIITTVDGVKAAVPKLQAALPRDLDIQFATDRTVDIRASLFDTQTTLVLAVLLVTFVVFLFLGDWRATLIPSIAVPVSIIGTFGGMYLLGYSLDTLSLMALTISTGFVVDDAIVVLENVTRHIEEGVAPLAAALRGAREVGFTVISITASLLAVFLPILLMGGLVGRLFREFAMTLSLAIVISLVISLTTTPMLCALLLKRDGLARAARPSLSNRAFTMLQGYYGRTLLAALRHRWIVLLILLVAVGINVFLFVVIPKGFFPQQDTGQLIGALQADQSSSFDSMSDKLTRMMAIVQHDPAVRTVVGSTGAGGGGGSSQTNTGSLYISLKPRGERGDISLVIARMRRSLGRIAGARLFLQPVQDIRVGGRQSNAQYQYTLLGDDSAEVYQWGPKLMESMQHIKGLVDVSSDQQQGGLQSDVTIDRATAARLGITASQIDNTLYDAFGQRSVSTIYNALNQYHVVMEVDPRYTQRADMLNQIWISTSGGAAAASATTNYAAGTVGSGVSAGSATAARNATQNAIAASGTSSVSAGSAVSTGVETMVPLSAIAHFGASTAPLAVNHQGAYVATTISFNLAPGFSLGEAQAAVARARLALGVPAGLVTQFAGTAQVFAQSLASEKQLVLAALIAIYIVLGVLYESYIHPVTILSTLPSAGIGALLALLAFGTEFSIIALIGVILLIGIVKKNAILMIDFALEAERQQGLSAEQAIYQACLIRLRPILMTTAAAMLGALPLAFSFGSGSELRRPLGIAILGGLLVSQVLTLYTTPVVYLVLDRLGRSKKTVARPA